LTHFAQLSVTGQSSSLSESEDCDSEFETELLAAYLRFRQVFVGSKQQLKKMTFERYQDLLEAANNMFFHVQMFPGTVPLSILNTLLLF
jgi:hypothetical protein